MTGPPPVLAVGAAAIDEWYAVSNLPEPDGGAFASEVTTAFGAFGAPGRGGRCTIPITGAFVPKVASNSMIPTEFPLGG